MGLLEGKVAIVTGAGSGVGRGIARRFSREGASVIINDIDGPAAELCADQIRSEWGGMAHPILADVSDQAAVQRLMAETEATFGGVDIIVNNAYRSSAYVRFEDKSLEELQQVLDVNLKGTWLMMREALPYLRRRDGGRVINFYSIDADAGAWLRSDYIASKAAIQALTRAVAIEWARYNILVNCVAPVAKGAGFHQMVDQIPDFETAAAEMNPSGRVGDPEEDIAPVAVFLASDMAKYVTGETIHVDGGLHITRYRSEPAVLPTQDTAFRPGAA
ncbi:glucose 1-dehydrogenase [Sphingomonas populi]|uniref:Glucose 1-dehydrogenase n=1 Tax=Sphingomonas populi TaxID=2484750 RepID=A0A4Q6Y2E9_9SPHN|nr:glucose 1-dehydrogenase [Sphingomonas populi]RZF63437.1 glucose 1-dehydrogenase [Sphingomonas populi]